MRQRQTIRTLRAIIRHVLLEGDDVNPNLSDLNLPPPDPKLGPNLYKSAKGEYVYVPNFNLDVDLSKLPSPWDDKDEEETSSNDVEGLSVYAKDVIANPSSFKIKLGDPYESTPKKRTCGNPPDPSCNPDVPRPHWGADLSRKDMGAGAHVVAPLAGTVRLFPLNTNSPHSGTGNKIEITHDGGVKTVFMHLNGFAVSDGATVHAGQLIGYLGSTGRSSAPHLHFEVRSTSSGEKPQDPIEWLQSKNAFFPIKAVQPP